MAAAAAVVAPVGDGIMARRRSSSTARTARKGGERSARGSQHKGEQYSKPSRVSALALPQSLLPVDYCCDAIFQELT